MKQALESLLKKALQSLVDEGLLPPDTSFKINLTRNKEARHGDFSSNLALALARSAQKKPQELAALLVERLKDADAIDKIDIAGPGFINFFLARENAIEVVKQIIEQGERFGCSDVGRGRRVQIEFVSANPTGPLHVGHGRGAAIGDTLRRLLNATGWQVFSEFYYNDAGAQITNLALSTQARCRGVEPDDPNWPKDGYKGNYIKDIAASYLAGERIDAEDKHVVAAADVEDLAAIEAFAVAYLRREQDQDLRAFQVRFDRYFLESSLYSDGKVEDTVQQLIDSGQTYQKDAALWLKTTHYGDDKDRVMRKSTGEYTYFVPDVAYHVDKWQRGFKVVINEQGADHHSTVTRVRAGVQAISQHRGFDIPLGWPDYVLHQMVLVMRAGTEVKLSKRAGCYVTLRDLIDEVGRDAARYFLVARAANSQLTFDIDLAVAKSNENPVYYIQYAHARICSLFRQLQAKSLTVDTHTGLAQQSALDSASEQKVVSQLNRYPEIITLAAERREPHQLCNYLWSLAATFHAWYNAEQFIVDDEAVRNARLVRCQAVKQVLVNGLSILGVSTPEEM